MAANRFCMNCRSEWFNLLPLVNKETGESYGPAVAIDGDGHFSAWTGRLVCSSCGHEYGTKYSPDLPPQPGPVGIVK